MNEKLNPCPKCNGKVHIEIEDYDYPCYEFVICEKYGEVKIYHFKNAIKKWNKETEDERKNNCRK